MDTSIQILAYGALKITVLIGLIVYAIFSFIMVRQERLMAGVLEEVSEPIVRAIVVLHFVASVLLLVAAFVAL